ncbi:hypothetical protein B0H14DRAFT_2567329 [Mycena olivaceomarginata]|nr:hypothetical protein B0H14DRAFT_2567329 [Mycena olivaceomarginata]
MDEDSLMTPTDAGQPQGQAGTSFSMTATDAGVPQGQAGTVSKKQAVMGPSRDKYNQLREELAYWKNTSAEEKKRREQAEADAVLAREVAQEGAKLELHSYIQEYEKDCQPLRKRGRRPPPTTPSPPRTFYGGTERPKPGKAESGMFLRITS